MPLSDPGRILSAYPRPQGQVAEANLAEMYRFAARICHATRVPYVIEVGGCFGQRLAPHLSGAIYLGIIDQGSPQAAHAQLPNTRILRADFDNLLQLDSAILSQSLLIWPNLDQNLRDHPQMAAGMAHWLQSAPFVLISHSDGILSHAAPEGPGAQATASAATQSAFEAQLSRVGAAAYQVGRLSPPQQEGPASFIGLGGTHALYQPSPPQRVLAIISCYNDADIIGDVARHLVEQGVQMCFIDNWSDDGTWELLTQLAADIPEHVVQIERFPHEAKDAQYNWDGILRRKQAIAFEQDFDWFIHYDSDELRTSCWPGVRLADAISFVDKLGYNAINHVVIDFRPTRDGFSQSHRAKSFFTHFELNSVAANDLQLKAWKKQPQPVSLTASGGHVVAFPNQKVYPFRFLLAHYSLRSTEQARRKIYKDRLPRVVKEHQERRYHGHYNRYKEQDWQDANFIWDPQALIAFDENKFFTDFFLKRLGG